MHPIRELFVSYTLIDDEPPVMRLVEDRETLETIRNGAPLFKRVGSMINVDSVIETHPIITIVCVTDHALWSGEPDRITSHVVQWLENIGEMWT